MRYSKSVVKIIWDNGQRQKHLSQTSLSQLLATESWTDFLFGTKYDQQRAHSSGSLNCLEPQIQCLKHLLQILEITLFQCQQKSSRKSNRFGGRRWEYDSLAPIITDYKKKKKLCISAHHYFIYKTRDILPAYYLSGL